VIDASAIEAALVSKLAGDPALAGLMPDGVYWDLAKQGATRFVIVSLSTSRVLTEISDGETLRSFVYVVKAIANVSGGSLLADADRRIHALLHHGTLDVSAAGCSLMVMRYVDRVRITEPDAADVAARWQHRGARYEITVTPT